MKISLKKINLFFLLWFFVVFNGIALEAQYKINSSGNKVYATSSLKGVDNRLIRDSMEEGQISEILFSFRAYYKKNKTFGMDRLLVSKIYTHQGYKDYFTGQYIVENSDRTLYYYDSWDDFFQDFLELNDFLLVELETAPDGTPPDVTNYYVVAQIILNPIKFEPPLHIITIFTNLRLATEWVHLGIE